MELPAVHFADEACLRPEGGSVVCGAFVSTYTRAAMPSEVISFARGAPSADILPVDAVREAAQRALTDDWKRALSYGSNLIRRLHHDRV